MITFKLQNESGGWENTAIPDDLQVQIQSSDGTATIYASLEELLRAYGYIRYKTDSTTPVYTSVLNLQFDDDSCAISIKQIDETTDASELQRALENLLGEIFAKKDDKDPHKRDERLAAVSTTLEAKNIEYDVFELHDRLTE